VHLYDAANLSGRQLTFAYPTDLSALRSTPLDSGEGDLNDRISSVQWFIPVGCKLVLYTDENYRGGAFQLVGSGRTEQNPNLGAFADQASSARWERS
jgi:hypothetical protein